MEMIGADRAAAGRVASTASPRPARVSPLTGTFRSFAVILAIVVGGLVSVRATAVYQIRIARLQVDRTVRADAAIAISPVSAELRNALAGAAGGGGQGATTLDASTLETSDGEVRDLLAEARDTGKPLLDDRRDPPSIVVAVYSSGPPPTSSDSRRARILAYRIVPFAPGPILAAAAPSGGGLRLVGPNRVVGEHPAPPPSGARTFPVAIDAPTARGWTLVAWQPSPGLPGEAWAWILALLLTTGALVASVSKRARRARALQEAHTSLGRNTQAITGLARIVQQSLDLAHVLPAASAHLCDCYGLAGLALSKPAERGERRQFAWGATPDATIAPAMAIPDRLASGATLALSLGRGGRVLGVLRVVAGPSLFDEDVRTLVSAGEILTSALANADAFAQQRAQVERMRSIDELKTVFLATASHELRTPIAAIGGFAALLSTQWDALDPEQARSFAGRIEANARSLDGLVHDLLDFSRLERGLRPAGAELIDIGAAVRLNFVEHPDLALDHDLTVSAPSGWNVRGSTNAIERILSNLVGNAAKYSPAGSRISVNVQERGDQVDVVVDDEGPGVPPADRSRIFSRFYRGSGDAVVKTRGAGIGLAIVSDFAASMSGTVTVGEAPSGGARFTVSFPTVPRTDDEPSRKVPRVPVP